MSKATLWAQLRRLEARRPLGTWRVLYTDDGLHFFRTSSCTPDDGITYGPTDVDRFKSQGRLIIVQYVDRHAPKLN